MGKVRILSLWKTCLTKHSKTASEQRLTVEFTAHPAWYAVQALPVVANPQNEDALSGLPLIMPIHWLRIVKENPRIKRVFDSWKAQGGTEGRLL